MFFLTSQSLASGKAVSTEMGWSGRQAPVQSAGAETDTLNAWWLSVSRLHAKWSVTTLNCQLGLVFWSLSNCEGKTQRSLSRCVNCCYLAQHLHTLEKKKIHLRWLLWLPEVYYIKKTYDSNIFGFGKKKKYVHHNWT